MMKTFLPKPVSFGQQAHRPAQERARRTLTVPQGTRHLVIIENRLRLLKTENAYLKSQDITELWNLVSQEIRVYFIKTYNLKEDALNNVIALGGGGQAVRFQFHKILRKILRIRSLKQSIEFYTSHTLHILLRYDWHIILYKLKMYSALVG